MSTNAKSATVKTAKSASKKTAAPKKAASTKKAADAGDNTPVDKKERKRREVTKDSVDTDFGTLQTLIEGEITRLRESSEKVRGIKFLRSINKRLKTLHSDTKRVMKLKKKNNRKNKTVSGFLKPVKITAELAAFTGWDVNQTYSRVDVTKFICDYIREHQLFNTEDKRLILCDDKLKTLLSYDPANPPKGEDGKPALLNYFRLQRYLKPHFIKLETPVTSDASKAEEKATTKKTKAAPKAKAAKASSKKVVVEEEDVEDEEADA